MNLEQATVLSLLGKLQEKIEYDSNDMDDIYEVEVYKVCVWIHIQVKDYI